MRFLELVMPAPGRTAKLLESDPSGAGLSRLNARQARVELLLALLFFGLAIPLAIYPGGTLGVPAGTTVLYVVALAVVSRVSFLVGGGLSDARLLVVVPMLLILPPGVVPLLACGGLLLGRLPAYLSGSSHPSRILRVPGATLPLVVPAFILAELAPGLPDWSDWASYLAALGGLLAADLALIAIRAWATEADRRTVASTAGWIVFTDLLLAPTGLLVAFAAAMHREAFLLVLPLGALMAFFARERNARIRQGIELSHTYRRTAMLLGDLLEGDDQYTGEHSRGVVSLAVAVADDLGVDPEEHRRVELGALLHDIGKIAVPKRVLNKPGPLTPHELEVMRAHTVVGQDMLERVGGTLADVGTVVRASHENYDGSGYPDGLKGEEIPLAARIVSACDAFHAMVTDRPYRRAMERHQARQELRRCAGGQFDPAVVRHVLAVIERDGWAETAQPGTPGSPRALRPRSVPSAP